MQIDRQEALTHPHLRTPRVTAKAKPAAAIPGGLHFGFDLLLDLTNNGLNFTGQAVFMAKLESPFKDCPDMRVINHCNGLQ